MALHFVVEDLDPVVAGGEVVLTGAEAHHAATVRRVRVGERVTIGDGAGRWLEGAVTALAQREVVVAIDAVREVPAASPRIVLAQALAKGDRDELAVQAATELGADAIVPWQAARSISRWEGPKLAKGVARWRTIAREAGKQAHRAWLPTVEEPVTTAGLAARAATSRVVVLDPWAEQALTSLVLDERDVILVVGPEGGIAPDELEKLRDAGADLVRMGDSVLRTSTAGPAAIAVLSAALRRW